MFIRQFRLDPTFGSFTLLELVSLVKVCLLEGLDWIQLLEVFTLLELVSLVKVCLLDSLDWIQLLEVFTLLELVPLVKVFFGCLFWVFRVWTP